MRPTTAGCSELTCPYHGGENKFKAAHMQDCPIRAYDGFVIMAMDVEETWTGPRCACDRRERIAEICQWDPGYEIDVEKMLHS